MRKRITRIRKKLAFVFQSILLIELTLVSLAESNSRPNLNAPAIGRVPKIRFRQPYSKRSWCGLCHRRRLDQFARRLMEAVVSINSASRFGIKTLGTQLCNDNKLGASDRGNDATVLGGVSIVIHAN
jgi:hypothetical protein